MTVTPSAGPAGAAWRPRLPGPVRDGLAGAATLGRLTLDCGRKLPGALLQGRFSWGEMVVQMWFIISVTLVPALLVTVPFGIILALQIGSLAEEIGAAAFMGSAQSLGVIREAAPMVTALLLAGAAGAAIAADLGARRVREEIDAMEVMGLDPVVRLVLPRLVATTLVAFLLVALVTLASLISAYFFSVTFLGVSPGSYLASMVSLARVEDYGLAVSKAVVFGAITAIVSCSKGLAARGGPAGVANGVSQTVILEFILLFAANLVMTQLYILLTGGALI